MPYRIAGIDVHTKMLAVVVADVEIDGDFHFERQKIGTTPTDVRRLADWLVEHEVEEVVMESTPYSVSPKSLASVSIPRSRSSPKSAQRPLRFPHPSTSPPGWAPAPATRRVRA